MFCKQCKKIIEKRIKYLESLDKRMKVKDIDRAHIIRQLSWLLNEEKVIFLREKNRIQ